MFGNKMKTAAIPERVYTICCVLIKKSLGKAELKEAVEPKVYQEGSTSYFIDAYEAALELELIYEIETMVHLNIEAKHLIDMHNFRKLIMPLAFNKKTSMFYKVTKAYLNANEEVFGYMGFSTMNRFIQEKIEEPMNITKDDMLAWRFWSSFLGLGILHNDSILIPNMYKQLADVLEIIECESGKEYTAGEFLAMLIPYCSFAIDLNKTDKQLNLGLSNGLRMLHDMGKIEIKNELDAIGVWHLYKIEEHTMLQSRFSHVRVRGKNNEQ